jgi:hypothetical protein
MPNHSNYIFTETEILALQLHHNLHGHSTYADDVEALVEELERRPRRSEGVDRILEEGRRFLLTQRRSS